jgi:cobalt-zinc-cadmium efflux system outer membrane protein
VRSKNQAFVVLFREKDKDVSGIYFQIRLGLVMTLLFSVHNIHAQDILPLAQDTVTISIADAEQRFVSKNLTLLMDKYNVNIAQAAYLQAKLWYNPNLSYGTTLYNQESKKFFDNRYPQLGEVDNSFQLQQLITIAGKHSANAKLAKVGIKQAEYQLADVLRSLKYQMCTDISDLYSNQQQIAMYQSEELKIKHLIESTQELYKVGNAAGNDVVRLQAQYQDIIAQEVTSEQAVVSDEKDLKTLLVYPEKTYLVVKEVIASPTSIPAYQSILDSAVKNRPDLMLAQAGVTYQDQNLKLQRSTGVPDLTLGISNIGAGSVLPNYWGISANIDLPFFNRNQGNISSARYQKSQAEINDSLALNTVKNDITGAYCTLYNLNKQVKQIDADYEKNLDEMMDNAVKNYDKRYINLLDLLSQVTTYIDGKNNLITLKVQYFNAIHSINYSTGIDIIK